MRWSSPAPARRARLADNPTIGGDFDDEQQRQPKHLSPEDVVIVRLGFGELMLNAEGAVIAIGAREIGMGVVKRQPDSALGAGLLGPELGQDRLRLGFQRLEVSRGRVVKSCPEPTPSTSFER